MMRSALRIPVAVAAKSVRSFSAAPVQDFGKVTIPFVVKQLAEIHIH